MNPSTIKELQVSLVASRIKSEIIKNGSNKKETIKLVSQVMNYLDKTKDKTISKGYVESLKRMSTSDYLKFVEDMKSSNKNFSIIIPPFNEPTLEDINHAMKITGTKSEYYLDLPEFGVKTSHPIAVGYLYYKKLEQQAGIKMSARSTGLVNPNTRQATQGKKAGGGQRVGELDSWCLINHGVTDVLREFFGPLADDHVTKNQIISDIIQSGSAEYRTPKSSPTREIFEVYLTGMMIEPDL